MNSTTIYNKHRENMQAGDGLSFRGEGFVSDAIEFFTNQERSHWGNIGDRISLPVPGLPLYEAVDGEYNIRRLSRKIQTYKGEIWWHQLKPALRQYRLKMFQTMWELVGIDYDYLSLFANILGRQPSNDKELFCSEAGGIIIKESVPVAVLHQYLPNEYLEALLDGEALCPGGMALLPVWMPEVQIV